MEENHRFGWSKCRYCYGLFISKKDRSGLDIGDMVADILAHVAQDSFFTIILFVIVGALVTMVVQASVATMAITLMLFGMIIPGFGFEQAAALAMGQNIGTTITANIAAAVGNVSARRAALAHTVFNVFGVIWVLCIFKPFLKLVCGIVGMLGWAVYLLVVRVAGGSVVEASCLATIVVALCSRRCAVRKKCVVTIFLICGIFPLVPGGGIFWTAFHLINGHLSQTLTTGFTAIKVTIAIILGIVFVTEVPFRLFRRWKKILKNRIFQKMR